MYYNPNGYDDELSKYVLDQCHLGSSDIRFISKMQYRPATIAQISRLYAGSLLMDDIVMTGDIDLIPLSDYWHPDPSKKTVYGFDLTGYKEYPICFIAMSPFEWHEVMDVIRDVVENKINHDLHRMPNAKSDDFYKWWGVDQQLITERLKPYNPTIIERGKNANGLAYGRVDRSGWSLAHPQLIDAHLFHQIYHKGREQYFEKTIELLYHVWPNENFDWFIDYTNEYRKLTGHT